MRVLSLFVLLSLTTAATALERFPAYVSLPAGVILYDANSVVDETLAEVEFPVSEGRTEIHRGRHVRSYLKFGDEELYRPAAATWAAWLPSLQASGWMLRGNDGATTYSLVRKAGGSESWLRVSLGDYDSPTIDLIEIANSATTRTLVAPAATPEHVADDADFPYFGKPEGAVLSGTGRFNEPLNVGVQGLDIEPQLVGRAYLVKSYRPPESLSKFEFETTTRAALAKAGWAVKSAPPGERSGNGAVVAHYSGNGRDLWLVAERGNDNGDSGLTVKIADLGSDNWAQALDTDCRLALYGLNFDFNKATLRADSTALLERVQKLLAGRGEMIRIEGHTDNVGGAAYNQKLSEDRAASVRSWLVTHGIGAQRLQSKGFGLTQPVADNATDLGRARNRRVELVRDGCR
jgi:outer membrane protein OmpA-like peptidoglycan-associated protein